jgi:hypothetical protein
LRDVENLHIRYGVGVLPGPGIVRVQAAGAVQPKAANPMANYSIKSRR